MEKKVYPSIVKKMSLSRTSEWYMIRLDWTLLPWEKDKGGDRKVLKISIIYKSRAKNIKKD